MPLDNSPREEVEEGAPHWMTTFSDMVTLLLTFFVLIVAYSAIEEPMFGRAMGSLRGALGGSGGLLLSDTEQRGGGGLGLIKQKVKTDQLPSPSVKEKGEEESTAMSTQAAIEFFKKIEKIVKKAQKGRGKGKGGPGGFQNIEVAFTEEGLEIRISADLLFKSGSAKFTSQAQPVLEMMAKIIKECDDKVSIEGHTDNVVLDEKKYFGWGKGLERYESNWELSTARATRVVRYLIKKQGINPKRLRAVGYADTRPRADNSTPEGQAKNRRVVFVILKKIKDTEEVRKEIKKLVNNLNSYLSSENSQEEKENLKETPS